MKFFVFLCLFAIIGVSTIGCSGVNRKEYHRKGPTNRGDHNTKTKCQTISDFRELVFEDRLLSNNQRVGAFSDAIYDSISGFVFLLSPYSTNAKVSYILPSDGTPLLNPYPNFDMNRLQCPGRMKRSSTDKHNKFKHHSGDSFSRFSGHVKFEQCRDEDSSEEHNNDDSSEEKPTTTRPTTGTTATLSTVNSTSSGSNSTTTPLPSSTTPLPSSTTQGNNNNTTISTPTSPTTTTTRPSTWHTWGTTPTPTPIPQPRMISFISIYSGYIDFCQRLWLLERGTWNGRSCTGPAIYIYDIRPNSGVSPGRQLIAKIPIDPSLYVDANGFQKIVVDSCKKECHKATAYIANSLDDLMLVYQLTTNTFRVYGDPSFRGASSRPREHRNRWSRGLHPMAIGPMTSMNSRQIFYTSDSSSLLHWIPSRAAQSKNLIPSDFKILGSTGCKRRISTLAYHLSMNVHFFADRATKALYCASGNQFIYPRNVEKLYYNDTNPGFPASMHLDRRGNVFIMYSTIDRYETGRIRQSEMHTRLVYCSSASIVKGTICECDRRRYRELITKQHQPEEVYES